jgi:hypothetical protein
MLGQCAGPGKIEFASLFNCVRAQVFGEMLVLARSPEAWQLLDLRTPTRPAIRSESAVDWTEPMCCREARCKPNFAPK